MAEKDDKTKDGQDPKTIDVLTDDASQSDAGKADNPPPPSESGGEGTQGEDEGGILGPPGTR